jgi:hypothetical protein
VKEKKKIKGKIVRKVIRKEIQGNRYKKSKEKGEE